MDATDYLTVSRKLRYLASESNLRTSASRAYYAAFHLAGERLEFATRSDNSFQWTGIRKDHKGLQDNWAERFPLTGTIVKNLLDNAHTLRKKADYDFHLTFTRKDLSECWEYVDAVIEVLRCEDDKLA